MIIINKLNRKSLLYLIIVAIVAILVCAGLIFYFSIKTKIPSISDCKDIECVKNYAKSSSFLADDCGKTLPEFKEQCYYTYEVERTQNEKDDPGKYCLLVEDKNLRTDCLFKAIGKIMNLPADIQKNINQAIDSLDAEKCDNINTPQWKEQCLNDLSIIKRAVDEDNPFICADRDESARISYYAKNRCLWQFPNFFR